MDERKEFHPVKLELDESAKRMIFAAKMVRIITTPVAFPIACIIGVYKWTWKNYRFNLVKSLRREPWRNLRLFIFIIEGRCLYATHEC